MGRPLGPKKVNRYSNEFKLTAVKLSRMPGVQVQTVATALDIHPFMLSRWWKEAREGVLRGRAKRVALDVRRAREIKRLQTLEREHAMLKTEHELLKKAIRFSSERRRRSSRLSPASTTASPFAACARSTAWRARAITRGTGGATVPAGDRTGSGRRGSRRSSTAVAAPTGVRGFTAPSPSSGCVSAGAVSNGSCARQACGGEP